MCGSKTPSLSAMAVPAANRQKVTRTLQKRIVAYYCLIQNAAEAKEGITDRPVLSLTTIKCVPSCLLRLAHLESTRSLVTNILLTKVRASLLATAVSQQQIVKVPELVQEIY